MKGTFARRATKIDGRARASDGARLAWREVKGVLLATEIDGREPFIIKKTYMLHAGDGEIHFKKIYVITVYIIHQ